MTHIGAGPHTRVKRDILVQVHLLALHEEEAPAPWTAGMAAARMGFAFLDAAAGRYYVGTVRDDAGRANLSALLTQVRGTRSATAAGAVAKVAEDVPRTEGCCAHARYIIARKPGSSKLVSEDVVVDVEHGL